jgi:hypothetical protein
VKDGDRIKGARSYRVLEGCYHGHGRALLPRDRNDLYSDLDWAGFPAVVMDVQVGAVVTTYRIYVVNAKGHTSSPPRLIECASDQEAIRIARQLLDGQPIEIWEDARPIAQLAPE